MSPGELLQQQCKYENHNFRAGTIWVATFDELAFLLRKKFKCNLFSQIRKRKLEKADILELTVKHLKNLQKIQICEL